MKQVVRRVGAIVMVLFLMMSLLWSPVAKASGESTGESTDADWDVSNNNAVRVTGDAENGYVFAVDKAQSGVGAVAYKKPVDFTKQAIGFRYSPADGEWCYMALSAKVINAAGGGQAVENSGGAAFHDGLTKTMLRFTRDGETFRAGWWYGFPESQPYSYTELATIENFAWDEEHIMGFVKIGDNWHMQIDGIVFTNMKENTVTTVLNTCQTDGGAYIMIGARANNAQKTLFDTVRFIDKDSLATVTVTAKNVDDGNTEVTEAFLQGGGVYGKDKLVTVTAPEKDPAGFTFLGWYNAGDLNNFLSRERSYTFEVKADVNLVALYKADNTSGIKIVVVNEAADGKREEKTATIGKSVELHATGENFQYWTNQFGMIVSREADYSFYAASGDVLTAHYETEKAIVIWESDFGQVIGRGFYGADDTIIVPAVPSRLGYTGGTWNMNEAAIKAAITDGQTMITVKPEYTVKADTYTVNIVDGILDGKTGKKSKEYNVNEVATVTADVPADGEMFSHWIGYPTDKEDEAKTLSYSSTYKFYVSQNYTVKAVFVKEGDAVVAEPTANIVQTELLNVDGIKKIRFVSVLTVPEGCTIEYGGILATANEAQVVNEKLNPATADFVRGKQSNAKTLRFVWTKSNVKEGEKWYVCPYLVYSDSQGTLHTIVGEMVTDGFNIDISQAQDVE